MILRLSPVSQLEACIRQQSGHYAHVRLVVMESYEARATACLDGSKTTLQNVWYAIAREDPSHSSHFSARSIAWCSESSPSASARPQIPFPRRCIQSASRFPEKIRSHRKAMHITQGAFQLFHPWPRSHSATDVAALHSSHSVLTSITRVILAEPITQHLPIFATKPRQFLVREECGDYLFQACQFEQRILVLGF